MTEEINKDAFIQAVAQQAGFTLGDTKLIFDAMIAFLEECVRNGTPVNIRGFGHLLYNEIAGYKGTHPVTQEEIEVPSSVRVSFRLAENIRFANRQAK